MMDKDEDDGLFVALFSVVCLQCERQIMFGHDNVCVCMCVCECVCACMCACVRVNVHMHIYVCFCILFICFVPKGHFENSGKGGGVG